MPEHTHNLTNGRSGGLIPSACLLVLALYGTAALAQDLAEESAATGAGEHILQDGDFQGWYNGFGPPPNFDAIFPSVPTAAAAGVPEPATLGMGLTSLLIWIGFRFCGGSARTH